MPHVHFVFASVVFQKSIPQVSSGFLPGETTKVISTKPDKVMRGTTLVKSLAAVSYT